MPSPTADSMLASKPMVQTAEGAPPDRAGPNATHAAGTGGFNQCGSLPIPTSQVMTVKFDMENTIPCAWRAGQHASFGFHDEYCPFHTMQDVCRREEPGACWDPWIPQQKLDVDHTGGALIKCGEDEQRTPKRPCAGYDAVRFKWIDSAAGHEVVAECGDIVPEGWSIYNFIGQPQMACPGHTVGDSSSFEAPMCLLVHSDDDMTNDTIDTAPPPMMASAVPKHPSAHDGQCPDGFYPLPNKQCVTLPCFRFKGERCVEFAQCPPTYESFVDADTEHF